jgi:predicted transposase YbfD/YdcC
VPADRGKGGQYFVVLKANQPRTLEAVALSFADVWTPRARLVVGGARHGDREERRTSEASTEVVSYLAAPEALDAEDGEAGTIEAGTIAGWPALGQGCRIHREVDYVSGAKAGTTREEWAYALTSLPPALADAARLEHLWRGHWQIENGLHYVRDVTLGEDASQVRAGHAPANLAACRNAALNLRRQHGVTNVAAALRRHAMYPRLALALMGFALE